jgi:hypothetical protein
MPKMFEENRTSRISINLGSATSEEEVRLDAAVEQLA